MKGKAGETQLNMKKEGNWEGKRSARKIRREIRRNKEHDGGRRKGGGVMRRGEHGEGLERRKEHDRERSGGRMSMKLHK